MSLLVRVLAPMPPPKLKSLRVREWVAADWGWWEGGALRTKGGMRGIRGAPSGLRYPKAAPRPCSVLTRKDPRTAGAGRFCTGHRPPCKAQAAGL